MTVHGVFTVFSVTLADFSVCICDIRGSFTVSSSAISAVFAVYICGSAWRTDCVIFCVSIEKVCNKYI